MNPVIELTGVSKHYGTNGTLVAALREVSLTVEAGTFTAVMGPSGSGKSTLLAVASGLDRPTSGTVRIDGIPLSGSEAALTKVRRERIGVVFQQYNLLPTLTVAQNVVLPVRLAGHRVDRERVTTVLRRLGVEDSADRRPVELSGGQQQRVAIARALVQRPAVILADEPTGALDSENAREVLVMLREAVRDEGQTVVMVTHDPVAASYADSVTFLRDGQVAGVLAAPTVEAVADRLAHLSDLAAVGR